MNTKSSLMAASLVLAAAVASAHAATVDLSFTGVNPGMVENVSTTGIGGPFTSENTGQFNFNVSNPTGGATAVIPGSTVATWCVELSQLADNGSHTYTLGGNPFGPYLSPLTNVPALTAFFDQFYSTSFTTTQATAFQLDIWELEFDTSPGSLTSGNFQVGATDAAVTLGNTWLSSFTNTNNGAWVLFQLHNNDFQDQIFAVQGGGSGQNPTPLPPAYAGGMLLLAGLALCAKVRRAPVL